MRYFYGILSLLMMGLLAVPEARGQVAELTAFRARLEGDTLAFPIELPKTIQEELKERALIPDPFVGTNEERVQWVSDRDWSLRTVFEVPSDDLRTAKEYLLRLSRVDTFGEVYLNGGFVGTTENYFRDYAFEVKGFLKPGRNILLIRLLSPTRKAHVLYESAGINYPADNDRAEIHYSPLVRTSPYHYGWDWGPRLISMGVDAPVLLERVSGGIITDLSAFSTLSDDYAEARIRVKWTDRYADEADEYLAELFAPDGKLIAQRKGRAETEFLIKEPRLWYPRGMGGQELYTARVSLLKGGEKVSERELAFGIRKIVLDRKQDAKGESFAFRINGKPFYAKGANYLPHDRRFRGDNGQPYPLKELFVKDLLPTHINMLRVWGGGEYETEEFYSLADSLGILVWQDFPFACSTYPNDPAFRRNVALELRDNLARIRNHPSIALFCGNNEVLEGIDHWGWKKKYGYTDQEWAKMRADYDDFFRSLLPSLVEKYAPDVAYIHGSPISANWGDPASLLSGDSHYWGVWFGGEDFDTFDDNYGRFSSEFGFQAFPELKTIRAFAPGVPIDSLGLDHPLLKYRQRSFIGNKTIAEYMKRHYAIPERFSDFIYVGQLLQGHGMDYAIRAIRRGYPTNRGLLFWQLNDVWPTVSWSSIDYFGNWKALHYKLRSALAPVIVDIVEKEGRHALWLCSDTPLSGEVTLALTAIDFSGRRLWSREVSFMPPTGEPFSVAAGTVDQALLEQNGGQMAVLIEAKDPASGSVLARRLYYPLEPKDLDFPPFDARIVSHAEEGQMTLTITAESLVKDLFIRTPDAWQGARFSDNYFDLLPGEERTVTVTHPAITPDAARSDLTFQTLNDL